MTNFYTKPVRDFMNETLTLLEKYENGDIIEKEANTVDQLRQGLKERREAALKLEDKLFDLITAVNNIAAREDLPYFILRYKFSDIKAL